MNWIAVLLTRWGFWWCVVWAIVAISASTQDSGTSDATFYVALGLGAGGGLLLGQVQNRVRSRPCPRCGKRVPNGRLDCAHCDLDFNAL